MVITSWILFAALWLPPLQIVTVPWCASKRGKDVGVWFFIALLWAPLCVVGTYAMFGILGYWILMGTEQGAPYSALWLLAEFAPSFAVRMGKTTRRMPRKRRRRRVTCSPRTR